MESTAQQDLLDQAVHVDAYGVDLRIPSSSDGRRGTQINDPVEVTPKPLIVPAAFKTLFYIDGQTKLAPCGSITDKYNLFSPFLTFKRALRYIADVHRIGLEKYQPYSWLVDPKNTDGTPELCLLAAMRHITAHDMGCTMDTDGLPHLYHYICRLGMAAVASIRELEYSKQRNFKNFESNTHFKSRYHDHTQDDLWYNFILPEHLVALSIGIANVENVPFCFYNQFAMCLYTHDKYITSRIDPVELVPRTVDKIDPQLALETMCYVCTCFFYACDYVQKVEDGYSV